MQTYRAILEENVKAFKDFDADLISLFLDHYDTEEAEVIEDSEIIDTIDHDGSLHQLIDVKIDISYYDLRKWSVKNYQYVEEAIEQGLCEGVSDFHQLIQAGQYVCYQQATYQEITDIAGVINEIILKDL